MTTSTVFRRQTSGDDALSAKSSSARLRPIPTPSASSTDRRQDPNGKAGPVDASAIALARDVLARCQFRGSLAPLPGLFGDPAWELLLFLLVNGHDRRTVATTDAANGARLPLATGVRWLKRLEHAGLVSRRKDEDDRRRSLVALTGKGTRLVLDMLD